MLNVTFFIVMLSVITLNVIMLNALETREQGLESDNQGTGVLGAQGARAQVDKGQGTREQGASGPGDPGTVVLPFLSHTFFVQLGFYSFADSTGGND
jgi:hypothetical protein